MRKKINDFVIKRTGGTVLAGPFSGMKINPESVWGDGDLAPKLLGVYEQELHDIIAAISTARCDAFVNIGCADGFYAVGLARLCSELPIIVYDIAEGSAAAVEKNAAANGVADRIEFRGACTPQDLIIRAVQYGRMFVLCDCEGFEATLFDNEQVVLALRESDLLIECHDFLIQQCTPKVFGYLWNTHRVDVLYNGSRDPNCIPMLMHLTEAERWTAVCEYRPAVMNWLYCRAR